MTGICNLKIYIKVLIKQNGPDFHFVFTGFLKQTINEFMLGREKEMWGQRREIC